MSISLPILDRLRPTSFVGMCVFWCSLSFSKAIAFISLGISIAFWILDKLARKEKTVASWPCKAMIPLLIYVAWNILSISWSDAPFVSLSGVTKVLEPLFIYWIVSDLFSESKRWEKFVFIFHIWIAFLCLDSFWQYKTGFDLLRNFPTQPFAAGVRVSGPFKIYGLLGTHLVLTLPFLVFLGLRKYAKGEKKNLIFYFIFIPCLLVILFLTRGRGAMISAFVSAVFLLIAYRKYLWLLFFFGATIFLTLTFVPKSMIIHFDSNRKEQSLEERFYLWDRALHVIKAKPVQGTGLNTYALTHGNYDKTKKMKVLNYYAHNGYLQMTAEIGLVGLSLFLWFLVHHFLFLFHHIKKFSFPDNLPLVGLVAGLGAFLLLCTIDTSLHNSSGVLFFWFFLGLSAAYCKKLDFSRTSL